MRIALVLTLLAACATPPTVQPPPAPQKLKVATLSVPVDWAVRRIAGTSAEVTLAIPADEDPPHYQPSGEEIAKIAEADLIVYNGAGFEAWMQTATLPKSKLVNSSKDVELIKIKGQTHSHGSAEGQHSHAGTDPHTWGDAASFLLQAREIEAALLTARPLNRPQYERGMASIESSLSRLDAELIAALEPVRDQRMASSHPAFNYMARRAGVDIHAFDFDPSTPPSAEQLREFNRWRGGMTQPVLMWEARPTDEVKAAFPSGVRHLYLDPLEHAPEGAAYDYVKQYKANVDMLRKEFLQTP